MRRAIFGLGNPGKQYEMTRHNAGFMALDVLCEKLDVKLKNKASLQCMLGMGSIGSDQVILAKPMDYMNNSGWGVGAVCDYYDIEPENIIVIYDDVDIPFGELRIRTKGSPGTHNGMKSITECLGTVDFPRVRIGIGPAEFDMVSFVLGKFDKDKRAQLDNVIDRAADACICVIAENVQKAQERYQKPPNTYKGEE